MRKLFSPLLLSGMFSLHLSGKHTPSGYCPPIVYSRRSGVEKCTCMSQVVFLLPSREGERESEREIFNDACCVDFVEEMEVFDCVLKGLINICFAPK